MRGNSKGSVTSQPAVLNVQSPLIHTPVVLETPRLNGGNLVIGFQAEAGIPYLVETAVNVAVGWQSYRNIDPVAKSGPISVEIPITESSAGFVRVRVLR